MNSPVLTSTITALANVLGCNLTTSQITILAAIFVQLGDTLATMAVVNDLCAENSEVKREI